jgi:hypothetical protein
MKIFTTLVVAVSITSGTALAGAGDMPEEEWSSCIEQIREYYGRDVNVQLVNKRRHRQGMKLRVAVSFDADNTVFGMCLVTRGTEAEFSESGTTSQPANTEYQETLSR